MKKIGVRQQDKSYVYDLPLERIVLVCIFRIQKFSYSFSVPLHLPSSFGRGLDGNYNLLTNLKMMNYLIEPP